MSDRKHDESKEVLEKRAVAEGLVCKANDYISSAISRINDHEAKLECHTAEHFLYSVRSRIGGNIPKEYHAKASVKMMLEDVRKMRDSIVEAMENPEEGKISIATLLPKPIRDLFLDLGREADFIVHEPLGEGNH